MVRPARATLALLALLAFAGPGAAPALAQEAEPLADLPAEPAPDADAQLEAYLDRLGLRPLQADHLAAQLRRAKPEARGPLAQRLAKVYVALLEAETDPARRRLWEDGSRELLSLVPESESFELRLNLAKAGYVKAEEIVERHRLRLASAEEVAEADRLLRALRTEMSDVATKVHRRVEALEKAEESGRENEALAEQVADARRLRSLAFYYTGWT
ncbi:MAG TPA: hypothetical protein VD963_05060, partial [Phycisphaerales bacterium]|nr:hypothetical protein [Phycisphaerales bacterium]